MITNHWIKQIIDEEIIAYLTSKVGTSLDASSYQPPKVAQYLKDFSAGHDLESMAYGDADTSTYPEVVQNAFSRWLANSDIFDLYNIKWTVRASRDAGGNVLTFWVNKTEIKPVLKSYLRGYGDPGPGVDISFV